MISFECEHCGRAVSFEDNWAGQMGRCPACQQIVDIPGDPAAEAPVEPGSADPSTGSSADTTELTLTPDVKDPAEDTDILPAQNSGPARQVGREQARNEADSWLRTYKQSKAGRTGRSKMRWPIVVAAAAVAAIIVIIALVLLR